MSDPRSLYELHTDDFDVPLGLHMVAGLTGFTDAGSTVRQLSDHIFSNLDHRMVATFDNDELLDYRARRPVMFFEKDHIADYEPAVLGVYLVTDEAGQNFLYLHGYEPDFRWEAFTEALADIIDLFEVQDFTWVHSIPFPIPHTRAVGVTVSGNRRDLIDSVSEWKPTTQVPGNVLHLIEYRLASDDFPLAGLVILVPHYLSDIEYPQAAVAAFEQLTSATGLVFPTDSLRDEGVKVHRDIAERIADNRDLAKLVAELENGFNNNSMGLSRSSSNKSESNLPTAEEIASELEDYLSLRRRNSENPDA